MGGLQEMRIQLGAQHVLQQRKCFSGPQSRKSHISTRVGLPCVAFLELAVRPDPQPLPLARCVRVGLLAAHDAGCADVRQSLRPEGNNGPPGAKIECAARSPAIRGFGRRRWGSGLTGGSGSIAQWGFNSRCNT